MQPCLRQRIETIQSAFCSSLWATQIHLWHTERWDAGGSTWYLVLAPRFKLHLPKAYRLISGRLLAAKRIVLANLLTLVMHQRPPRRATSLSSQTRVSYAACCKPHGTRVGVLVPRGWLATPCKKHNICCQDPGRVSKTGSAARTVPTRQDAANACVAAFPPAPGPTRSPPRLPARSGTAS